MMSAARYDDYVERVRGERYVCRASITRLIVLCALLRGYFAAVIAQRFIIIMTRRYDAAKDDFAAKALPIFAMMLAASLRCRCLLSLFSPPARHAGVATLLSYRHAATSRSMLRWR